MAITDNLVAAVALLKSDADATSARWAAAQAASADAVTALQQTVDALRAQVDILTAGAADPAVIAQLESDITAIDAVISALA